MKKLFVAIITMGLLLIPLGLYAQSDQMAARVPPVAQSLIPEGDFALKLAPALKLGTPDNEAQAEDILTSAGIAPRNGWIADYPVTPDIIGELQNDVAAAADSQKLPMGKDEALNAFQNLIAEFGLAVAPGDSGKYAENQPQSDPAVINNYYYEQGPPVVSYYPPPWDYNYLYAWVPYPFWSSGFFFSGYFILHDFHRVVIFHQRPVVITNHAFDHKTRKFFTIDPGRRFQKEGFRGERDLSRGRRFDSGEARRGAQSIFDRNHGRQTGTMNPAVQGPSRQQVPANRGPGRHSTIERGTIRDSGSRSPASSGPQTNMGGRGEFNNRRPSENSSRSFALPRASSPPSSQGRESFGGFQRNIQRPPESAGRSFGAPNRSFNTPRSAPAPSFQGRESFGGSRDRGSGGFQSGRSSRGIQGGGSGRSFSGGFPGGVSRGGGGCRGRC